MLGDRTIQVIRGGNGHYENGYWVQEAPTKFDIIGSAQPLSPRESLLLPEGDRVKEWLKIYTKTELKSHRKDECTLVTADRVIINSKKYVVMKVWPFDLANKMALKHWKIEVCLENENTIDEQA